MIYETADTTKEMVKTACKAINPQKALDLMCGDGYCGKKIKESFPECEVFATDISDKNFTNESNINWKVGDLFSAVLGIKFDLIICAPPYLPTEIAQNFQPKIAYDGGSDGFRIIQRVINEAPQYMSDNSKIYIEIYHEHGALIPQCYKILKDHGGYDRFISFTKGNYNEL